MPGENDKEPSVKLLPSSYNAPCTKPECALGEKPSPEKEMTKQEKAPEEQKKEPDKGGIGFFGWILILISTLVVILTFPLSIWTCMKLHSEGGTSRKSVFKRGHFVRRSLEVVREYERAVIFRLGRVNRGGAKGPGILWILPCTDTFCKIDLRTISFSVPPQEVLTKDSVTILVDAVVFYRIFNATIAVTKVDNANQATQLLAQTTLRNMLGTKNLMEILVDREEMADLMGHSLYMATKEWGIKVERVEIKDVKLPESLQRAMAAEAEAARHAKAKVIAAEGEMKASRALKEAAVVMSESPAALQLRYLQTLSHIAAEKNSTVVFPVPIDLLSMLAKK